MRLCIIGKYPPIQGGVSARTYRLAHELARRGHAVHVVTNAREVEDAYRIHIRPEDESRYEAEYGAGYVRVHWTAEADHGQWHVPWHNPFVTKLASLAADVVSSHELECIFSYYLEPYAVAGHLAAAISSTPHVIKTAGSDVGRLWHQRHFRELYDFLFRHATVVIASRTLGRRLVELGVERQRIVLGGGAYVPLDEFHPCGVQLQLTEFSARSDVIVSADRTIIGMYGKLGERKGIFALLHALRRCLDRGVPVHLAAMVQGRQREAREFRDTVAKLALYDHVTQLPFLPHWRVPEFLRMCSLVCCLEQDFPIRAHAPIIPQEAMATGVCTLLSQEIAAKQPEAHLLVHGFNCLVVRNATDDDEIARGIMSAVTSQQASAIGERAREYATTVQSEVAFPDAYETAFEIALGRKARTVSRDDNDGDVSHGLHLLLDSMQHTIAARLRQHGVQLPRHVQGSPAWYQAILDTLQEDHAAPIKELQEPARFAMQLLQTYESDAPSRQDQTHALFRFTGGDTIWRADEVFEYVSALTEGVTVATYGFNPVEWLYRQEELTGEGSPGPLTTIVTLPPEGHFTMRFYCIEGPSASLLALCDGKRTIGQIAATLRQETEAPSAEETADIMQQFFRAGILTIHAPGSHPV